ncbi:MAG: hypothetical protein CVV41_11880 [Candidatus Riflebacteria bacterium HGW-Riflebacteria-1]|jgi:hypothetical protein|nr:MAG: hypothetical protein CVV41_11880 [Candidatus Riflebacteria bacterium HGW-Riflebacteria-1]
MKTLNEQADKNEMSEIPDELKLELKTPLETFFMWAAIISCFFILAGLIGLEKAVNFKSKLLFSAGCMSLVVFGSLYFNTDNYYIVDRTGERILYHFKFFFFRKVSTVCRFNEISLITSGGKHKKSKHAVWWEYAVFILTTNGELLPMSDYIKEAFDKQKELARKLSDITGARFIDAPEERIVRAAGLNCVRHEAHTIVDTFVEIGMALLFAGIAFAVFVTLAEFGEPLWKMLEAAGK